MVIAFLLNEMDYQIDIPESI